MKRTAKQMVFDLLDKEGDLGPTEIVKRLGIPDGTASSSKNAWKVERGRPVGTREHPIGEHFITNLQRVVELLDKEPYLTGREIATRLEIKIGTAQTAKTKWNKMVDKGNRNLIVAVPGPRFRKAPTKVAPPGTPAPAEVTMETLLDTATPEQLGSLLVKGILEVLRNKDDAIAAAVRVIAGKEWELQAKEVKLQLNAMENKLKEIEWGKEKVKLEDRITYLFNREPQVEMEELKERILKKEKHSNEEPG